MNIQVTAQFVKAKKMYFVITVGSGHVMVDAEGNMSQFNEKPMPTAEDIEMIKASDVFKEALEGIQPYTIEEKGEKEMNTIDSINETFEEVIEGIKEFAGEAFSEDVAESMMFVMTRAQKSLNEAFDGNHETANKVVEVMEAGHYNFLDRDSQKAIAGYLKSMVADLWNKEYMTHCFTVIKALRPEMYEVMGRLNLDTIELSRKNKNDLTESELKEVQEFMDVMISTSAEFGNTTCSAGWDENGRPYTFSSFGNTQSVYYLDTHEFKIS
jgi:hypothetical protein